MRQTTLLAALALLVSAVPCWADKNEYMEVYPFFTATRGEVEIEFWNDSFTAPSRQQGLEEHGGHQVSVEYGITDRWMAEVYGVWHNNPSGQGIEFIGNRLETRYRLADYNRQAINPAVYLDYFKNAVPGGNDELEGRLILSRDLGEWNVTGNFILEKGLIPGAPLETNYALGVNHPISKTATVSLEGLVKTFDHAIFIIPSVNFPLGHTNWVGVGFSIQTKPTPTNVVLRTMFSHEFR